MEGLTWIHLSDWHQKGNERDKQVIRDALIRDVKERVAISPVLAKVNFIIFSGDVAYSGQPNEYNAAKQLLFDPLLEASGLESPEKLFIVPGNHDLDKSRAKMLRNEFAEYPPSYEEIQNLLNDREREERLLRPFRAFSKFVHLYTGQEHPAYACYRNLEIEGKNIALIGLNSALNYQINQSPGSNISNIDYALIGESQIRDALNKVSNEDIKIAVFHHPPESLNDYDRKKVGEYLSNHFDYILHGHHGRTEIKIIHNRSGDCVVIPAGASVSRRMTSYNFVHLNFATGKCVIFPRRWNDPRNEWIEDKHYNTGGMFELSLRNSRRSDRIKQIRSQLLDLAKKELLSDDILADALRILNSKLEYLNPDDQMRNELLEKLLMKEISQKEFNLNWKHPQVNRSPPNNLKLITIKLEQIRCFANLFISIYDADKREADKWMMILGDNATGKTTLLRSIAIGLCNESDGTTLMQSSLGEFIRKGAQKGIIRLTLMDEVSKKKYTITTTIEKIADSEGEFIKGKK